LHSVLRRNHIQNLSAAELRDALLDHGMDVKKLLPGDELFLENSAEATAVVAMLNEDFFNGYFSSLGWSASGKSPRKWGEAPTS
jgi:hypothetical protein